MRISDWSSDVCSSDLAGRVHDDRGVSGGGHRHLFRPDETPRRLDAQDAPRSIAADRRHRAVLDDVDAAGGGGARIAPGDRIVPGHATAAMPPRATHRITGTGGDVAGRDVDRETRVCGWSVCDRVT